MKRLGIARQALAMAALWVLATTPPTAQRTGSGPPQAAAIPNMAGQILTVTGPIDPQALGPTLMHEHIFIDLNLPENDPERWGWALRAQPAGATEVGIYNHPLTLDILERVEMGFMNRDNLYLTDGQTAIDEVNEFKKAGGKTIVDVTSIGLKRDPMALRQVANTTGLQIVMGASWYRKSWHPLDMDTRSVASLADEIVQDVAVGAGGAGIRAGIIGEVGTQGNPLTPNEIKVIQASGRASRLTGAAITLHTQAREREQPRILDLLAAEGAALQRVVVGHSNPLATDLAFMKQLLDRGVYIQFDTLGRTPRVNSRNKVNDTQVATGIVDLIKAGYLERILIAQDVCTKIQLKAYGGTGYSYVLEQFVPYLKELGVTDAQIETIMVTNPRRVLTFVAPMPPQASG